jgi:hypothetical protein
MRYLSVLLAILIAFSVVGMADDNRNLKKVTVKQNYKGADADLTHAFNYRDFTSVMVWTKTSTKKYESRIYASYISFKKDKSIKVSKPKLISNSTDYNYTPSIAYNSYNNSYLVVWASQVSNQDTHVLARKLNAKGRPKGGIIKVAAEKDATNSSPQVTSFFAPFGPGKEKHRYVIAYSKTWPTWKKNVYNGVCIAYLDLNGRCSSSIENVFDAGVDPDSGEAQDLRIGNISSAFGPYYFMTITRKYYAEFENVPKSPDTFLFQFSDVTIFEAPKKIYSGIYEPAQTMTTWNVEVLVSWFSFDKEMAYLQLFKPGPQKAGPIKKPAKKEGSMAAMITNFWSDFYFYNYDGEKTVTAYKIGDKGKGKEKVGSITLPDYLGQEMLVYWANNQEKGIIATNEWDDNPDVYDTELVIYYFDAPDWENQGAGAPPEK